MNKSFYLLFLGLLFVIRIQAAVVLDSPYDNTTTWAKTAIHIHALPNGPDPPGKHTLEDVCKWLGDTNSFAAYIITQHDLFETNAVPPFAAGLFIQGQEVTRTNHTIAMFITNKIAGGYPTATNGDPQTIINDIVAQGGLAGLAHPNYISGWSTNLALLMTNYQYVEVNNIVVSDLNAGGLAEDVWDFILTAGRRVYGYAGLDMHSTFTTNAVNQVFVETTNEATIKAAITHGNLVFGRDTIMRVSTSNMTLLADTYGVDSRFEWIGNGGVIRKVTTAGTNDSYRCAGSENYVRLRTMPLGTSTNIAYSQPVWTSPSQFRTRASRGRR